MMLEIKIISIGAHIHNIHSLLNNVISISMQHQCINSNTKLFQQFVFVLITNKSQTQLTQQIGMCTQQRFKSAYAAAQFELSLSCMLKQ